MMYLCACTCARVDSWTIYGIPRIRAWGKHEGPHDLPFRTRKGAELTLPLHSRSSLATQKVCDRNCVIFTENTSHNLPLTSHGNELKAAKVISTLPQRVKTDKPSSCPNSLRDTQITHVYTVSREARPGSPAPSPHLTQQCHRSGTTVHASAILLPRQVANCGPHVQRISLNFFPTITAPGIGALSRQRRRPGSLNGGRVNNPGTAAEAGQFSQR